MGLVFSQCSQLHLTEQDAQEHRISLRAAATTLTMTSPTQPARERTAMVNGNATEQG